MIRLTYERVNGIKSGYWSPAKKDELVQRLGAYEDTGLLPGEIRQRITWIPCWRQLPGDDRIVLVTCRSKKGSLSVNRAYYDGFSWHGSGSMAEVIAWMPLPEPYDDGGGSDEK